MRPAGNRVPRRKPDRTPEAAPRSPGFTYTALLAAIVIIGITMSAAGKYWQNVMQREREEELLFRGGQYQQAIERYFSAKAPNVFPAEVEQLLKDDRFPQPKRHLRHQYKDPITGEDFELIRDQTKGNRITGVFSKSEKEPLRKTGFPDGLKDFERKTQYLAWKFVYTPQVVPPGAGIPGQPIPGRPPVRPPTGIQPSPSPFPQGHPPAPGTGR